MAEDVNDAPDEEGEGEAQPQQPDGGQDQQVLDDMTVLTHTDQQDVGAERQFQFGDVQEETEDRTQYYSTIHTGSQRTQAQVEASLPPQGQVPIPEERVYTTDELIQRESQPIQGATQGAQGGGVATQPGTPVVPLAPPPPEAPTAAPQPTAPQQPVAQPQVVPNVARPTPPPPAAPTTPAATAAVETAAAATTATTASAPTTPTTATTATTPTAASAASEPTTASGPAEPGHIAVSNSSGLEDTSISLSITLPDGADPQTTSIQIGDIPAGATLTSDGVVIDVSNGTATLTPDQLANLSITPPENSADNFTLDVSVNLGDGSAVQQASLGVDVSPVADQPTLDLSSSVTGNEDTSISLGAITAQVTDLDGSESITNVTISNIPDGSVITVDGTQATVSGGSVSVPLDQLNNVAITPPTNYSGSFDLTVTATSTDTDTETSTTDTAQTVGSLTVNVNPVADPAQLTFGNAAGLEDTSIKLDIQATPTDPSETVSSITLGNIPDGAVLTVDGVQVSATNGSVTLTPDQLSNLAITPPHNSGQDFSLDVTVVTNDGGSTTATTGIYDVSVQAVADTPTLQTLDSAGLQGSPIALDVSSALTDTDGSETLSLTIGNIPDGAVLSSGGQDITIVNGAAQVSPDQLAGLSITPPANFVGSFNLSVTSTSTDTDPDTGNVDTASATSNIDVTVASDGSVAISNSSGLEDTAIPLNIVVPDTSGVTTSVTLDNIPDGAVLTANGQEVTVTNNSATLSSDQLSSLTITPPHNSDADFALGVTVSQDDGTTVTTTNGSLDVSVTAVADAPTLDLNNTSGVENTAINLDVSSALTDTDGSESLSLTIGNIPDGAVLRSGDSVIAVTNGQANLTSDQLNNLTITPPNDFTGTLDLSVTSTSTESSNLDQASVEGTINIEVAAQATTPTTTTSPSEPSTPSGSTDTTASTPDLTSGSVTGAEDHSIPLDVHAALTDTDGSETLSVTINDIPNGSTFTYIDSNGDTQTIDPAGATSITLTPDQLNGLAITPPLDYFGDFNLSVQATSTEQNGGETATVTETFGVTVTPVLDNPIITDQNVSGEENTRINLDLSVAMSPDTSVTVDSVIISNIPDGSKLYDGATEIVVNNGFATVSPSDVSNLAIEPPQDFQGNFDLTVTAVSTDGGVDVASFNVGVTPDFQAQDVTAVEDQPGGIQLNIDAGDNDTVTIDGLPDGATLSAGTLNQDGSYTVSAADLQGLTMHLPENLAGDYQLNATGNVDGTTLTFGVNVAEVADAPTVTTAPAAGNEDTAIPLNIGVALTDTDGSESITSVTISGVPDGAVLSAGTANPDGTWTLTQAQLDNLTITPPQDYNGTIDLSVTAVSTETASGDSAATTTTLTVDVAPVNDAPVAQDATIAAQEDGPPVTGQLQATDVDTGDTLTYSLAQDGAPAEGTVTVNADGSYSFDPGNAFQSLAAGETQNVTFTYQVDDGHGGVSTAIGTVTVTGTNDAPVAQDATIAAQEDGPPVTGQLQATDVDTGDTLTYSLAQDGAPAEGTVTINADGSYSFDPGSSFQDLGVGETRDVTFTYQVDDGNGGISTAIGTVIVTGTNDAPVAQDEHATATEDGPPISGQLDATDVDVGDNLQYQLLDVPKEGDLTFNSDGTYTFDPGKGFQDLGVGQTRDVTFTYQVDDGHGGTDTATVTITVTGTNDGPVATDDTVAATENQPVTFSADQLLANDSDVDTGDVLTITSFDQPDGGTVTQNQDGSFTFTPNENFTGQTTFTYTISDGHGGTSSATVTLDVAGVEHAPTAVDDTLGATEDGGPVSVNVLANDSDADGNPLTVTDAALPDGVPGTLSFDANGNVTYDPGNAFQSLGAGETTSFDVTYTVSDGQGGTSEATVAITVTGTNDAPVAQAATISAQEDGPPVTGQLHATDVDTSDTLTYSLAQDGAPAEGTVTINADGSYSFDPGNAFQSLAAGETQNVTFTYQVDDGHGGVSTAIGTVTVTGTNDAPVAQDATISAQEDGQPVTGQLHATDVDTGDVLTYSLAQDGAPTEGTVTINADGTYSFDPGHDFQDLGVGQTRDVTFTYQVDDGHGGISTAIGTVTVTGTDDAPVAHDDTLSGTEDQQLHFTADQLLANDTDVDTGDVLTITSFDQPDGGTVTQNQDGSFTFTPNEHFSGQTTFTYTVSDGHGGTSSATVTLDVAGVEHPPTAVDDSLGATEDGGPVSVNVLANDSDIDGDTLTVTNAALPDGVPGTLSFDASGNVTYDPGNAYQSLGAGETTSFDVSYTVSDGQGGTSEATVAITVTGTNDAPIAQAATISAQEDGPPVTGQLHATDVDTGDNLTYSLAQDGAPAEGTVTVNADGTYSFDPGHAFQDLGAGQTRDVTFTYQVDDGNGGVSTAIGTVTVTGTNDAPVAQDDTLTAHEDGGAVSVNVLANDSDVDTGDTLTVTGAALPDGVPGTLSFDQNGAITYDPGNAYQSLGAGQTTAFDVSYTVADGHGGTSEATVTITVEGTNDAPVAHADTLSGTEDQPVHFTADQLLANDSDVDTGDTLTITSFDQPDGGTVTQNQDGSFTFTPNDHFSGQTTFSYTVSDSSGATSTATVTLDVAGVADAPTLDVSNAAGNEDTAIPLTVDAQLTDPSEHLTITLSDIPDGAVLASGGEVIAVDNSGNATLTQDQLQNLTITPPHNSNEDFQLTVTATSADGSDTASTTGTINVDVKGVADAPTLDASFGDKVDTGGQSGGSSGSGAGSGQGSSGGSGQGGHSGNSGQGGQGSSGGSGHGGHSGNSGQGGHSGNSGQGSYGGGSSGHGSGGNSGQGSYGGGNSGHGSGGNSGHGGGGYDGGGSGHGGSGQGTSGDTYHLNISSALTDTDGSETLSLTVSDMPNGATLSAGTENSDGSWTLTPNDLSGLTITLPQNSGDVSLTVTATSTENDGDSTSVSETISLNRDIPPVAQDDTLAAHEDGGAVSVNVLANDSDADGGTLSVTGATLPDGVPGTLTYDQHGNVTYDPGNAYQSLGAGETTSFDVSYTVSDGQGGTSEATVTVTVTGTDDAPVAQAATISAQEDGQPVTGQLQATDVDTGDTLTYSLAQDGAPAEGSVTVNPDGAYSFDPGHDFQSLAAGETQNVTFTYQVDDGHGGISTAIGTVTVTGTNDAPVAHADTLSGTEDQPVHFTADQLLANDTDVDTGDTLTITSFDQPDGGTVTQGQDGSFTFTPNDHFSGQTTFSYTMSDSSGATSTATVTLDVAGVADAPTLDVSNAAGNEDTAIPLTVDAQLTDPSEHLTITLSDIPDGAVLASGGEVIAVDNSGNATLTQDQLQNLTITPPHNSNEDFQLTVTATSADGSDTASTTGTIDVDVKGVADAPTLDASVGQGQVSYAGGGDGGSGGNDFVDDGSQTHTGTNGDDNYVINRDLNPNENFNMGNGNDSIVVNGNTNQGHNFNMGNGDDSVTLNGNIDGNTAVNGGNGNDVLYLGKDSTHYQFQNFTDNQGHINTQIIDQDTGHTITVNNVEAISFGDGHTVGNADLVQSQDSGVPQVTYDLNISSSLTDTDGSETLSITVSDLPDGAVLSAGTENTDGSWTLTHDQLQGLSVTVTGDNAGQAFNFNVSATSTENDGDSTTVTHTLTAGGASIEHAPAAVDDSLGATEDGGPVSVNVLANDSDIDGNTLAITAAALPDGVPGTLSYDEHGNVTYDPGNAYQSLGAGETTSFDVSYTVSDGQGGTSEATVTITVTGTDDAPVAQAATIAAQEDGQPVTGQLQATDVDTGDTLTYSLAQDGAPDEGTVTVNADGTYSFDPGHDFQDLGAGQTRDVTFTYQVDDGNGGISTAIGTVTVTGTNDAPVAQDDTLTAHEDGGAVSVNVLANDSDVDTGDTLTVTGAALPDGVPGTLSFDQNGAITYDPGNAYQSLGAGQTTAFDVSYTVADGHGGTSEATVTITVEGTNDAPVAHADTLSGTEDQPVHFTADQLLANDSDVDTGDTLTITSFDQPDGGTVTQGQDGSFTFTPNDHFSGQTTFSYTVSDSSGATSTATVTLDVAGVADAPHVETHDVSGTEDHAVTLDLGAALTDTSGSETLAVTLSDIPDGAILTDASGHAIAVTNGSADVSPNQLSGLQITPPANYNGSFNLTVTATSTETANGDTATTSSTFTVDVAPEADAATIDTHTSSGNEDSPIALDIDVSSVDHVSAITISDVPQGAELSAGVDNHDGTWTLSQDDLHGLTVTPPANSDQDFSLGISVTTTDGGDTAVASGSVDVAVTGVADAPHLTASLGDPTVTSTGGETTQVTIDQSNVTSTDAGFTVTAQSVDWNGNLTEASVDNVSTNSEPGGFGVAGWASGADSELGYDSYHGTSEKLSVNFDSSVSSANVSFAWMSSTEHASYEIFRDGVKVGEGEVTGVTDNVDAPVTLTADDGGSFDQVVFSAPGTEDDYLIHSISYDEVQGGETAVSYPLNISSGLTDTDGSESLSITVSDLPDGATLSAGTENSDGSWTLTSDQLHGLTVSLAGDNANQAFNFNVTATSTEDNGDTASVSTTLSSNGVAIDNTVEGSTIDVSNASGNEDTAINLDIDVSLADTDGSESVSITISDVPDGAVLSAGTDNHDGTWTLTHDQLQNLTITPPADSNQDFSLTITAVTTESSTGETASSSATLDVGVTGVADAPTLSVDVGDATVNAGGSDLTPAGYWTLDDTNGSSFADQVGNDDGTSHGDYNHSDLNTGDTGQFGTDAEFKSYHDQYIQVDNSSDLKPDSGALTMWFNADKVDDTRTLASSDSYGSTGAGHFGLFIEDGHLVLKMEGSNSQTEISGGDVSKDEWNQVTVTWGAGGANIYLNGQQVASDPNWTEGLSGNDNPWTFGADQSGSSDGEANHLQNFFDGHLDDIALYSHQLSGDQVSTLFNDGVQAAMDSSTGAADTVTFPVTINSALTDTDGSESLSLTLSGMPDGATLSAGTENNDGTWTIDPSHLANLTMTVPADSSEFDLNVAATSTENDGDSNTVHSVVTVDVPMTDLITEPSSFDHVGTSGDDTIYAGDGADAVSGGEGNDVIYGDHSYQTDGAGNDVIFAGGGDDTVIGGGGADQISGGDGNDTIYGDHSWDTSNAGNDTIDAGAGDDTVYGGGGNDVIEGGSGNDKIYGDLSSDIGDSAGNDTIDAGSGDDTVYGGGGDDVIHGGSGNDTLYGDLSTDSSNDGSDTLFGGDGSDTMYGGGGDDTLYGGSGDDTMYGGSGNDSLDGGAGDDTLYGGDGHNTLIGGDGNDTLYGGDNGNSLSGGNGNDTIFGGAGNDTISGGAGNDTIDAGAGNDTIDAGAGNDHVVGGAGNDLFVFGSGDGSDYFDGGNGWSDTVQVNGVDSGPAVDATAAATDHSWTLHVDGNVDMQQTDHSVTFTGGDASGKIELADGSELTFQGVDKLEW